MAVLPDAEGADRDRASLSTELALERSINRLRRRILGIRDGATLLETFSTQWVEELRGLGIPAHRISIQFPVHEAPGHYIRHQDHFLHSLEPVPVSIQRCPWVQEAWDSQEPVVVSEAQLRQVGFNTQVCSLIEVPLPGMGSIGVNSTQPDAFDATSAATIAAFFDLALEAFERVTDFETLAAAHEELRRHTDDLEALVQERTHELQAMHRIREQVWQMRDEGDIKHVLLALRRTFGEMGISFRECRLHYVDTADPEAPPRVRSHNMTEDAVWRTIALSPEEANRNPVLQIWKRGQVAYRSDLEREDPYHEHHLLTGYKYPVRSVIDVPFPHGTLSLNSEDANAFSPGQVAFLERVAEVTEEGFRRLDDIREIAETQEQLSKIQRLETVGQLAGGIAHDFNNFLTVITGHAQMLQASSTASLTREAIGSHMEPIVQAGEKAGDLVRQLLAFGRRQVLTPEVVNLNDVVRGLEKLLHRLVREDIRLGLSLHEDLGHVSVDRSQLEQVLVNLVVNARDAIPRSGDITIETENVVLSKDYARQHVGSRHGPHVLLAVSDTGVGMDTETRMKVFEPFFTTKEEGEGTGLGLATVYGIVKQSGGNVWVYSEPGKGATFKVYLPVVEAEAQRIAPRRDVQSFTGSETVLLVEDDDLVRGVASTALTEYGYAVLEAADPSAAMHISAGFPGNIHLLLTDVIMPGMNGRQLAAKITAGRPGTKVLFVSGYTAKVIDLNDLLDTNVAFLPKPFGPAELAEAVRATLDRDHEPRTA